MMCLLATKRRRIALVTRLFAALVFGSATVVASAQPQPEPSNPPAAPAPLLTAEPTTEPPAAATAAAPPAPPGASGPADMGAVPSPPATDRTPSDAPRDKRGNPLEGRPYRLAWQPGEVIPPGYIPWSSPSKRFLISGMVVGGAPYLGSAIAAYVAAIKGDLDTWGPLFAPVVGPFIAIETASAERAGAYLLVLNGLAQTAGAALFVVSLVTRDHGLKRTPSQRLKPVVSADLRPGGASLMVAF